MIADLRCALAGRGGDVRGEIADLRGALAGRNCRFKDLDGL